MIIDIHAHLWLRKYIPEKYWYNYSKNISRMLKGSTPESILDSSLMRDSYDGNPERLIKEMDQAGIDKSVVFGVDWGLALGEPQASIIELNDYVLSAVKKYPDRLIGLFTIDPRRKNSDKLFEEYLDKGMSGLKLHPTTGYLPNGPEAYKLYLIALKRNVPVLSHSGYASSLMGSLSMPSYFDSVTSDIPDLKICLAHMSGGAVEELIDMMFFKSNVYCDISTQGQISATSSPANFYLDLKHLLNYGAIQKKVLFGSDWPLTGSLMTLKKWVKTIKKLPTNEKAQKILTNFGYKRFTEMEINKVLGENAQEFLKEVL